MCRRAEELLEELDGAIGDLAEAIVRPCADEKERAKRLEDAEALYRSIEQLGASDELDDLVDEEYVEKGLKEAITRKKGLEPKGMTESDFEKIFEECMIKDT